MFILFQTTLFNHDLNNRQIKALEHIIEHGQINMQELSLLYPNVNKRTLQREMKVMIEKSVIESQGATNKLIYLLKI